MALQSSGPIRFSDLAAEFGDTKPYSFSEFYRDGGKVPGVNASVAASGAIRLGTFFGAVNELLQTVTANASINAQTIFGSDWGSAVPKRLSIPAGVTIGPLTIPSGMGGSLEVDVAGNIYGTGGSANGGAGGHAITSNTSFTLNVLSGGSVRGGGGGGGKGGTGGGGSYTVNTCETRGGTRDNNYYADWYPVWNGSNPGPYNPPGFTSVSRGPQFDYYNDVGYFYITVCWNTTSNTNGGAGGNGGRGQGYNQSLASGSGGAGGGTNAGTGGTGGSGGNWGASGATGNTGVNGNRTNGSGGSAGGAAGRAVQMNSGTVTVNNSGTINGAY